MADISKISPDDGSTILNIKDGNAVHWADNTFLGAKNIIPFPYSVMLNNQTVAGVTHTMNADGSITCSGTGGNGGCNFVLPDLLPSLKKGSYIFSSGVNMPNGCYLSITLRGRDYNISNGENQIPINLDADAVLGNIRTWFANGTPVDLTIYPMLRLASDTDDTYAPYAMTNRELTTDVQNAVHYGEQAEGYVGKNLFKPVSQTVSLASDFIVDEDDYISHPANDYTDSRIWNYASSNIYLTLKAGTYIVSAYEKVKYTTGGQGVLISDSNNKKYVDLASSLTGFLSLVTTPVTFTLSQETTLGIEYKLGDGKYALMIRKSSISDGTYEPYLPTNKELMDTKISGKKVQSTVSGSSVTFTDADLTSDSIIDGPYVGGMVMGIASVTPSTGSVTFTFTNASASGQTAYIWIR